MALPLVAAEEKKTTQTATTAAPAPAAQPDSPLVAAAKRANRRGKKPAHVITNETLKTVGANAHVTTTTMPSAMQAPKPLDPPRPTPEMAAAEAQQIQRQKAAEEAEQQRKAKETQQRKAEQEAAMHEEGYDGTQDDASDFTGAAPPPPQF